MPGNAAYAIFIATAVLQQSNVVSGIDEKLVEQKESSVSGDRSGGSIFEETLSVEIIDHQDLNFIN